MDDAHSPDEVDDLLDEASSTSYRLKMSVGLHRSDNSLLSDSTEQTPYVKTPIERLFKTGLSIYVTTGTNSGGQRPKIEVT